MVEVEYRIDDVEPLWQKIFFIGSVVLLMLLVPTTALGYYAEKSIPGQTLYPMKRAIEAGILALESLTPYGKSSYLLSLADTRVSETSTLVENAVESGNFDQTLSYSDSALAEIVISVREAQSSIQQISDPVKKQQAEQNLANAVQKYQNNLQSLATVAKQPGTTFVGLVNSSSPTPPISPDTSATDTATPTPPSEDTQNTTSSQAELTQQIQQTQNDLQQIENQLSVTPDPNLLPTPTRIPTDTPTPVWHISATPTPFTFKHNDSGHRNGEH